MAATNYTPIQLYRTTTASAVPSAGNLAAGELAINTTDEKIFFKNTSGTVVSISTAVTGGTVTSVAASGGTTGLTFSGSPITTSGTLTLSGTLAVANGGTGVTTSTGSGSVVLSTSPALTTPNLGTPSAVTLTNGTGLPVSTGISGLGTGVATFLGTPSSANLAAAVTDETGSGSLVFGTTPTLTGMREIRVAMGANNIDLSAGNYFSKTITTTTTLTVSNVPTTGTAASFILDLTNGGSSTVTWWSGVKWAGGTAPTLTTSGRDVLGFFTYDGGTTWSGFVLGLDVK